LKLSILIFLYFITNLLVCQNALVEIDEKQKDIGAVENIYKIKADFILQNNLNKNLYLLRADVGNGTTVRAAKKTLKPNDTTLLVVELIPQKTGSFKEIVNLITSADGVPFVFSLSGNIKSIKTDDKTACFYFGKSNKSNVKTIEPIIVPKEDKPKDVSNRIPDNSGKVDEKILEPTEIKESKNEIREFDESIYKANNIIFLIDVSSSMKDSSKLPVMQNALYYLIEKLRPIDRITIITYSDSVKILKEGTSGNDKDELKKIISKLKAKVLTKGKKAILFSLEMALKHYISGGNNQILLSTDGKFRFYPDDQNIYLQKQGNKLVKLSTLAFGNDKEALKNLKDIAEIGKGNFIHIKNKNKAQEQLLDEIKQNSLIR
jgi:Mg-chelatase subunit ChlD